MKRLLAVLGLAFALAAPGYGLEPERPDQDTFIARAVFAQGKLWVLTDAGALSTITEGASTRDGVALPEPARDLWVTGGQPMVVTCEREKCRTWTIRRFDGQSWQTTAAIKTLPGETLGAATGSGTQTVLLTSLRILSWNGGDLQTLKLAEPLFNNPPQNPFDYGRITSVLMRPDRLYFGLNAGEWGGGLWVIDRRSGKIASIKDKPSGKFGTIISVGLDPVNGLAEESWKPGCLIAAVGMVHMYSHGRLVEVCGDEPQRLYFKPCSDDPLRAKPQEGFDEPFETIAFFGLISSGDMLWAAGIDGLYRITKDGVTYTKDMPKLTNAGGIYVSFNAPNIVVVFTEINQRDSLSGATPMIVPRP